MTRKQVARKLAKSIATVRALEGVHLHPVEDERGVWRFDPEEVECIAGEVQSGRVKIWDSIQADPTRELDGCGVCQSLQARVEHLEAELQKSLTQHRHLLESVEHGRLADKKRAEARQADEDLAAFIIAFAEYTG